MSPPDTGQGESKSRGDEDSFTIRQYPGLVNPSWDCPGLFSCPSGPRGEPPTVQLPWQARYAVVQSFDQESEYAQDVSITCIH